MNRKLFRPIWYIIGFMLLTLACRSVTGLVNSDENGAQVAHVVLGDEPLSTFVPLRASVRVGVDEPLLLESYHVSRNKLAKLEIFVNDQPLRTELSSAQGATFSPELASVNVIIDREQAVNPLRTAPAVQVAVGNRTVEAFTSSPVQPEIPTSDWLVSLLWTGHVPGSYDLSLKATDITGREGEVVVQRIEVR